jgi:dTDP-4-dehydrorhamnose reductase
MINNSSSFTIHHSPFTILLTGASGYLGQHLALRAAARCQLYSAYSRQPNKITAGQPVKLDLTGRAEVLALVRQIRPQAIIHAAAINPGHGDAATMWRVNVEGSRYVAEAAVEVGARLVAVSTDVVHDGQAAPYADDAPPSPLNDYGRSKAAAEAAIMAVDPTAAIVRTSLIYGLARMDRGTESFVERLAAGEPLLLFSDVVRNPVWVESLAEALLRLVANNYAGLLNVAGRQALTREAFGRRMLAYWQVDPGDQLSAVCAAEISATIPLDLRLAVDQAERLLGMTFPGVDEVLASVSAGTGRG